MNGEWHVRPESVPDIVTKVARKRERSIQTKNLGSLGDAYGHVQPTMAAICDRQMESTSCASFLSGKEHGSPIQLDLRHPEPIAASKKEPDESRSMQEGSMSPWDTPVAKDSRQRSHMTQRSLEGPDSAIGTHSLHRSIWNKTNSRPVSKAFPSQSCKVKSKEMTQNSLVE